MKKPLTWAQVLSIFAPIVVSITVWLISLGTRVETMNEVNKRQDIRDDQQDLFIKSNEFKIEKIDDKVDENFKLIQEKLDKLLYEIRKI